MSSAHRPTWEPAKGKSDIAHLSQAFSKHSLPAQTKLKFRKPGDQQRKSLQELKEELAAGEKRAKAARNPDADDDEEEESDGKRRKLLGSAEDLDADDEEDAPKGKEKAADDDDDEEEDEEDDEDEDEDEEDDTEALLRELEKIKQERREEQERREQRETVQDQMTREEEIARGNPLLNLENALHGDSTAHAAAPSEQRWDEDLIFRNQAAGTTDLSKRGFVNDLTRTSPLLTQAPSSTKSL